MSKLKTDKPAKAARAAASTSPGAASSTLCGESRVFVRDLMMTAKIGLHQHERLAGQRIRINLDLTVADNGPIDDDYDNVVCYGGLVTGVRQVVGAGHVNLAETLAERIAEMCLADRRVLSARIRVEKLDVFPEAASVGVEIERFQRRSCPSVQ
jgi:dihydroneopterin aldolase